MRKGTVGTNLNGFIVFSLILGVSGTVFKPVQRTVAEKTVHFLNSLMAGIIFTCGILKKFI